jgi:beta-galactosidase
LLKFSLSGPGEIVAVDAGDPTCHTPFRSDEIKAFGGLATVIVRRTGAGKIVLTAESDGLKKARWRF